MKRGGHEATIPRWSDKSLRIDAQPKHQTHRTNVSPAVDLITKRCAQRVRCETKNTFSTRYAANTLTEYTRSRINRMGNEQKVRIHSYTLHFIVAFVNGFGFIQAKSRYTTQSTVCVHIIYHIVFSHIQIPPNSPRQRSTGRHCHAFAWYRIYMIESEWERMPNGAHMEQTS